MELSEKGVNRYLTRVNNSFLRNMTQDMENEPMEKTEQLNI